MSRGHASVKTTNGDRAQALRRFVGVASIAALALAFFWMASHFIPGEPHGPAKKETPSGRVYSAGLPVEAEQLEEVPYGDTVVLDDLTHGHKYEIEASPYLREEWEAKTEEQKAEEIARLREYEGWDHERPAFSVQVTGCHLLTEEALTAWYPHYSEASLLEEHYAEEDVRVVVVDLQVENLADEATAPPHPVLRHGRFSQARDWLDFGLLTSNSVQAAMHGVAADNSAWTLLGGWDALEPGETKTLRYGYLIYRNTFSDPQVIDQLRLSDFDVAYFDWNPRKIIALQLADA